mmetsp:Transcript_11528/g.25822  ORF Transcript_11528/g.25822 Transcript_11528/m.25822 type:complete len:276 (-) Transcript_11528:58-885(-)
MGHCHCHTSRPSDARLGAALRRASAGGPSCTRPTPGFHLTAHAPRAVREMEHCRSARQLARGAHRLVHRHEPAARRGARLIAWPPAAAPRRLIPRPLRRARPLVRRGVFSPPAPRRFALLAAPARGARAAAPDATRRARRPPALPHTPRVARRAAPAETLPQRLAAAPRARPRAAAAAAQRGPDRRARAAAPSAAPVVAGATARGDAFRCAARRRSMGPLAPSPSQAVPLLAVFLAHRVRGVVRLFARRHGGTHWSRCDGLRNDCSHASRRVRLS